MVWQNPCFPSIYINYTLLRILLLSWYPAKHVIFTRMPYFYLYTAVLPVHFISQLPIFFRSLISLQDIPDKYMRMHVEISRPQDTTMKDWGQLIWGKIVGTKNPRSSSKTQSIYSLLQDMFQWMQPQTVLAFPLITSHCRSKPILRKQSITSLHTSSFLAISFPIWSML